MHDYHIIKRCNQLAAAAWFKLKIVLNLPVVPLPSSNLVPSGDYGMREVGGSVVERLLGRSSTRKRTAACSIGRVSIRFGEGGG